MKRPSNRILRFEISLLSSRLGERFEPLILSMPDQTTMKRALKDKREGKSPSTHAGEFVREEFHHIREGKHGAGARSAKQAIAIGLSKARRAGVKLPTPAVESSSSKVRRQAKQDRKHGQNGHSQVSMRRSHAMLRALKREGHGTTSTRAISRQTRAAARRRTSSERSTAAYKAVLTSAA